MKFGVIVFPGSNCDRDMMHALQDDLQQEVVMLWHKDRDLSMFSKDDCIVLPGGFSYGDSAKSDWNSDIRWTYLRRDGVKDVYRIEWTFRLRDGVASTRDLELAFDGFQPSIIPGNEWQVISIEPKS